MTSWLASIRRPFHRCVPIYGQSRIPRPGKPSAEKVFLDSIDIVWDAVFNFCEGDSYEVRIVNTQTGKWHCQSFETNRGEIGGLKPDTPYVFKVRLVTASGDESKYSKKSEKVKTHITFASKLAADLHPIETDRKGPDIYALPMVEVESAKNESALLKKYCIGPIGNDDENDTIEKTIIFIGATGTGKSTLVDGFANYILGVQLEDSLRFTVMQDEDRVKQHDQAQSKTVWITCYSFNPQDGTRLKCRLNVIDTPGFGDTRGLERDQEIVEQIRQAFETHFIQGIDAVSFLLKAPESRLTSTQNYIFHAVMSLLGKDIEGSICTLITFADGGDPPVKAAIKASGFPFGNIFIFNNSALFSEPTSCLTTMFWDMGLNSFKALFDHLHRLETKSIQLTEEVLQERHHLDVTCKNLQSAIIAGLSTIERLREKIALFEQNYDEINRNKNFSYQVTETKLEKLDLPAGIHAITCLLCNISCLKQCTLANYDKIRTCSAMDSNGNCTQCPRKCNWKQHTNTPFKIVISAANIQKTYKDMNKRYEDATTEKQKLQDALNTLGNELEIQNSAIEEMVGYMRQCRNRLNEIALQPNTLEMTDQIDLMIQAEKDEGNAGYQNRIEVLKRFRERAAIDQCVDRFTQERMSVKSLLKC